MEHFAPLDFNLITNIVASLLIVLAILILIYVILNILPIIIFWTFWLISLIFKPINYIVFYPILKVLEILCNKFPLLKSTDKKLEPVLERYPVLGYVILSFIVALPILTYQFIHYLFSIS